MPVTERLAGSGMLGCIAFQRASCHENDLRGDGPCFRVHDWHGRDRHYFADRVMTDILMFLGRGFALFAGGPVVIYRYPTLSRSAAVVAARRRAKGSSEW
jgi:hypothetical protein